LKLATANSYNEGISGVTGLLDNITAAFRKRFPSIHYGYVIIAACFLIMTLAYGAQTTFGVFFKPMSGEFGWSRAATSGPFALYMIVSGLLSIVSGRFSDRFGAWKIVAAGAIISGVGYILMYDIHSLWQLYVYYGILVAAGSSAMYVPMVAMIARWFTKRRGLMSGIGISGIGFGIGIMPPIASALLQALGWRIPLLIIGGGVIVLIFLLSLLLRADAKPYLASTHSNSEKAGQVALNAGLNFGQATRTPQFWLIFVAWVFYGFFFQIAVVHIVPYSTDLGMTAVKGAGILSIIGIIGTAGRISLGFVGDKLGNRRTVFISFALMGLAFGGLAFIPNTGMLYVFAVVFGFLFGIGVLIVPMVTEYFGFKQLGIISGAFVFANSFGGAIGPPVAGGIFDATGSYHVAFMACGIVALAAWLAIYLIKPVK
jgi:OFA family oxalate/formate antiporter-like MFS transporter